jgi:uncharacterized membrane protein YeaQ/YmgE (transglycosylase-associated protein family)
MEAETFLTSQGGCDEKWGRLIVGLVSPFFIPLISTQWASFLFPSRVISDHWLHVARATFVYLTNNSMGIISWIFLGLIAGALAKFILPGKDPGGFFVTILIGIVGGILGGFLGTFIGLGKIESFDIGGIIIATIGAILLLIIYRIIRKSRG